MKVAATVVQDVGVIIARFQVPELHEAHRDLISTVIERHDKVLIFLGLAPVLVTRNNPLDFEARKQMILAEFPQVNVHYVDDVPDDDIWSEKLDKQVARLTGPSQSAALYGSRDSFLRHYTGKLPTCELEAEHFISGSEVRREVSRKSVRGTPDFRAGVVWGAFNRYPTCFPTVDVAVFDENKERLLLARKEHESQWRLIGGFADPGSPSYEADARREVEEEAGISITDPVYVGSFAIDDWRYRKEVDCIKTLLFTAKLQFGSPKPNDDIVALKWFKVDEIDLDRDIVPTHHQLVAELL